MSWFYKQKRFFSEKNGTIVCERRRGAWTVFVDGYVQSGPYALEMWNRALAHLPCKRTEIKKILILGFAVGGNVKQLHSRFPKAQITAIEWDPVMINIAETVVGYPSRWRPRLILDEATHAVSELQETFDLILFDLYTGKEIMGTHPDSVSALQRILAPRGWLLMNLFSHSGVLPMIQTRFAFFDCWNYQYNTLALFYHYGRGLKYGDAQQNTDYKNYRSVCPYLDRETVGRKSVWRVGSSEYPGIRWRAGPLWFESYIGDDEPAIESFSHFRTIMWRPMLRQAGSPGWWRCPLPQMPHKVGFAEILDPKAYWKHWDKHALRHRAHWLKNQEYTVEETGFDEFYAAYKTTTKLPSLKKLYLDFLHKKQQKHGTCNHFFVGRHISSQKVVAGLAVLDVPEISTSIHLIAFYFPSVAKTSVNVGLIDLWFRESIRRGIRFLDFDNFRGPGDPRAWEGFSQFKSQFGTKFILFPKMLVKFVKAQKNQNR